MLSRLSSHVLSMALFSLFMGASHHAFGFINIESVRQNHQGNGLYGKSQVGLNGSKGNTDKNIVNLSSTNSYQRGQHEILGLLQYSYGETLKVRDTNNGSAHIRYAFELHPARSVETFVQSTFNNFQNLKHRDLFGVGLRNRLLFENTQFLFLGTGLFYENETLTPYKNNATTRANIYLSYLKKPKPDLEISLIAYYQPSLSDLNDFRIWSLGTLEYRLLKRVSLVNSLSVIHDSRPPEGIDPTDITYSVGCNVTY